MTDEPPGPFDMELPDGWRRIDPGYDFQLGVARNDDSGKVLAVEKRPGHAPWDHGNGYQTVLLPEMYHEVNEVKKVIARNVDAEEAVDAAFIYMENNG